jgi:hypothetical protein
MGAVVVMVRVAVPGRVLVMVTGLVEPMPNVGILCAFAGLLVMAADSATMPVKPPLGVTVIVEMLPVIAPGTTTTGVPVIVKPGTRFVTVTMTA